jgi:signal transduction histidine kinase
MTAKEPVENSFEAHLVETNLSGVRLGYVLAAVLMPAGVLLDWLTHPDHVRSFFWIRLATAAICLVLLSICYMPVGRRHTVALAAGTPLICAAGIEVMILKLDGYASPYYAGLNLLILGVMGILYVWHWKHALGVCGAIIGIWLVPSVPAILSRNVDVPSFFNNLYFLVLTTMISVSSTVIRYGLARREFESATKQARASAELAQTLERVQQLDRFKSQFFANVTHELKTPLAMILTPLELLLDGGLAGKPIETQRGTLEGMYRSGVKLIKLIDDLLDLSKLEESRLRLRLDEYDLVAYLGDLLTQVRSLAQRKGIALHFESNVENSRVWCDLERIERVVINLLSNATKFTPPGGNVWLKLEDDGPSTRIVVRDDGPGFPVELSSRVFERFFQADMADTRKFGGTGIGLALAKELVELHGGSISARSGESGGATFVVELLKDRDHFPEAAIDRRERTRDLPAGQREADRGLTEWTTKWTAREEFRLLAIDEATEQRVIERDPDEGQRANTILVVEDSPDVVRVIHMALRDHFRILAAHDGKKGLELAVRESPSLVITDLMMPEFDGLELTRQLRADASTRHIPIVMLTARADLEDRVTGLDTGVNAYLGKPFAARELLSTVRSLLGAQETTADLLLNQKMDSLEVVAGALAHEINNPLNYIKSALELLGASTAQAITLAQTQSPSVQETRQLNDLATKTRKLYDVAESGIKRIAAAVALMRRYSREGYTRSPQAYDAFAAARDVVALVLPATGRDVKVETAFDDRGLIECVPEEFNQVLTNLIQNAIEAAPEGPGCVRVQGRCEGGFVELTVSDNGPGIKPEDRAKVFTPFFTTKGPGRGMGMGLTIAHRVVVSAGGTIRLRSHLGSGTEFVVRIPEARPMSIRVPPAPRDIELHVGEGA